jgi:predicted ATPase
VYNFSELMEDTMGDVDFRAICKHFKAIVIRNMRKIRREEMNTSNRLIKLFDEAYFRSVKIFTEANVSLDELITPLPEAEATTEEDFAMIRCKSRLIEFQSVNYKAKLSYVETKM